MSWMFCECNNLENLNISKFNTENVVKMKNMFSNCKELTNLNLSSFKIKKVKDVSGIFFGCQKKLIDSNKSVFKNFNIDDLTEIK